MGMDGGARRVPVALDGFTALTAPEGGVALVTGMERERFPVTLLRGLSFRNDAVPGRSWPSPWAELLPWRP